jgi:hypothetical protein
MTDKSETFPNNASDFFCILCIGPSHLPRAGTGAGFDTVTAGSSTSGHTGRQILCLGSQVADLGKPAFATRSTPCVSICFPDCNVQDTHFPLGKQSIARPVATIPYVPDDLLTPLPGSTWRDIIPDLQSTTDPPMSHLLTTNRSKTIDMRKQTSCDTNPLLHPRCDLTHRTTGCVHGAFSREVSGQ